MLFNKIKLNFSDVDGLQVQSTYDSREQMLVADVVDDFCCLSHTKLADVVGRTRVVACSMTEKEKHLRQPSTDYSSTGISFQVFICGIGDCNSLGKASKKGVFFRPSLDRWDRIQFWGVLNQQNYGNQPKTMKNHETTLKNHGNQPMTIVSTTAHVNGKS